MNAYAARAFGTLMTLQCQGYAGDAYHIHIERLQYFRVMLLRDCGLI